MIPRSDANYDYILLLATMALIVIGILFIYSSGVDAEGRLTSDEYQKQIIWAIIGFFLMLGVSFTRYNACRDLAPVIYFVTVVLLIVTLAAGTMVNGSRSWLGIASFGIQPSEFMKIAVILLLAFYFEKAGKKEMESIKGLIISFAIAVFPLFLVLLQPDLGTAMVYLPIVIFMLHIAGAKMLHLVFIIGIIVGTIVFTVLPEWERAIYSGTIDFFIIFRNTQYFLLVVLTLGIAFLISFVALFILKKRYFFYLSYVFALISIAFLLAPVARSLLQEHQMMRLLVFLDPYVDPQGAGWNIIQSVTAVGSGGFAGKGFLAGTQSHFQFLPQQSTDFIFSILAEEWGFIGSILVMCLYLIIILRGITIAQYARDRSGASIAIGVSAMFFFHFTVSVGMAIGVMPITGIPLLFLSYGGSSLWTAMIGMGLLLSVSRVRLR